MHAAWLTDAPQIVAQQVNDHEVLCPVLLTSCQPPYSFRVLLQVIENTRRCALDGSRLKHPLAVQLQEPLGAGAAHNHVLLHERHR